MRPSQAYANVTFARCIPFWFLCVGVWTGSLPLLAAQTLSQWSTPTPLETIAGEAQFPRLAADASGTAIAVWAQDDGSFSSIWASRHVVGQGWEAAKLIEANPGDARGPWVAMDGGGNAIVVWSQYDGTYLSLWANRYVAGKGWGTAVLIETNPADADFARVAMDGSGNAMALWCQSDGVAVSIWANHYVVGQGWGTATILETSPGEASETWIAMDSTGNAMAVWRQSDGVDLSIWANRYVAGKGWEKPTLIEDSPGFASFPHVVLDSHGNALVVWYQGPDNGSRNIWASRYDLTQGWGKPILLEHNPGNAQGPDVAIDQQGRAMAVWRQFDGSAISIWASRYVPGEGWEPPIPIEENAGEGVRPAVAMDARGNAVAVWLQFDGAYDSVWANRYQVGEGWAKPTLIESQAGDARLPKVEIGNNGEALAVWSQDDGEHINILSNNELSLSTFVDVSESAGFSRTNLQSSWAAAWGDYDLDGYVDVVTLGHNQQDTHSFTQLWHNNGDGTFSDVTVPASLDTRGDSHGAVWADLDNDGDLDLVIAKGTLKDKSSRNYHELWRNNNDGTFINVAVPAGVTGVNHRGRGVSAVDYNQDGKLDLFIVSERDEPSQGGNLLFRNDGAMHFTDTASTAGLAREGKTQLFQNRTAAWADFNLDGFPDVFLAQPCALFLNKGNETFVDVSVSSGIGTMPECFSGTWGDYDNDGDLDLYISMDSDEVSGILYRNNDDGTFTDVTNMSEVINSFSSRSVMWGDYDNDGYLDLYIVNENNKLNTNRLFRNNGDKMFTDVTNNSGAGAKVAGGGADGTFIDYNNDGFLDIFITNGQGNNKGPYVLLKNTVNSNNWIKVKLNGGTSNKNGIMAKVYVMTDELKQFQEYTGPSHYMSQNKTSMHFGLGHATNVNAITIKWPNGISQLVENVAPNQTVSITEGQSYVFGKPHYQPGVDLGYFIWKQSGDLWQMRWSADGITRSFEATLTTDGQFKEVSSINFESNDELSWDSQVISVQALSKSGQDGLQFKTTGTQVRFDLKMDATYMPTSVHIGQNAIIPASIPFQLK